MQDDQLRKRRADFVRRAELAPESVYVHPRRRLRYIPVHNFSDEKSDGGVIVDAWCELPTDIALVESLTMGVSRRGEGLWVWRDGGDPHFLKVIAVLKEPAITRALFEELLEAIVDHPWCVDGFRAVAPDTDPTPLPCT